MRKPVKSKKRSTSSKSFNCKEVERYLDRAVEDVRNELAPKIELIERRHQEQDDTSRKMMADTNALLMDRQNFVDQKVTSLADSVGSLHEKFDHHVKEETKEWGAIKEQLEAAAKEVANVQRTINTVSANGNQGLHASLKDLYNRNTEVHDELKEVRKSLDTFSKHVEPSLRWHDLRVSIKNVWRSSAMFKIFSTRTGTFIAIAVPTLFIASLVYFFDPTKATAAGIIAFIGLIFGALKKIVPED